MLTSSWNLVSREDFFLPKELIYFLVTGNRKQLIPFITLHNWLNSQEVRANSMLKNNRQILWEAVYYTGKSVGLGIREIWVKFYFRDSKQVLTSLKFIFLICKMEIVLLLLNICFLSTCPHEAPSR